MTDRIKAILRTVLAVDIPDDASMGTIAKWDSLIHVDIITAVEKEFGVNFTIWEIENMTSLAEIVRQVEGKL